MNAEQDESVWSEMEGWFVRRTAQNSSGHLLEHIKPTDRILDVGCGVGSITISLAEFVPRGSVVGIDISQQSLEKAKALAELRDIGNVHFQRANAKALLDHFDSDSFDVIHSHNTMMHLDDPILSLQQQRALLKKGGFLSARDTVHVTFHPAMKVLDEAKEMYYGLSEERGAHAKGPPKNTLAQLTGADGGRHTCDWAHAAGFDWEHISCGTESWHISLPDDKRQWAKSVSESTPPEAIATGLVTAESSRERKLAWSQWVAMPNARLLALDGWIVCQKD